MHLNFKNLTRDWRRRGRGRAPQPRPSFTGLSLPQILRAPASLGQGVAHHRFVTLSHMNEHQRIMNQPLTQNRGLPYHCHQPWLQPS